MGLAFGFRMRLRRGLIRVLLYRVEYHVITTAFNIKTSFFMQTQLINISGRYSRKMLVDGFSASEMKLALEVDDKNIASTDIWGYQYLKDTIENITFKDMKIRHTWFVSVTFINVTRVGGVN